MGSAVKLRDDYSAVELRRLARVSKDVCRSSRLLSIAAVLDGMSRARRRSSTANLKMPENITPIFLPSRAPELNPVENIWQYLRQNWLSNRVFDDYDAIIDAACQAWRKLLDDPETITAIGMRQWAHIGQTQ